MKRIFGLIMILFLITTACENKDEDSSPTNIDELSVNPDFKFNTTMLVELNITSTDIEGNNFPNAPFSIYKQDPQLKEGSLIMRASTNAEGIFADKVITLPNYYSSIYIVPGGGEAQNVELNVTSTEKAELVTSFVYEPLKTANEQIKKGKFNDDKFDPITVSDNGFNFTLHTIISDCAYNAILVFSITNNNDKGFSHAKFGLPNNCEANYPLDGSIYYSATELYSYDIENPTNSPFRSIAFETKEEDGFKDGNADFFLYAVNLSEFDSWTSIDIQAKAGGYVGTAIINFDFDPNICYPTWVLYSPSEIEFATVAFEDYWPYEGDYDMNDLILDYNYAVFYNESYMIDYIMASFKLRAIGASYKLGFAFQLPEFLEIAGDITSTNGLAYVEADNRTVVVFEDARDVISSNPDQFINTDPTLPYTDTHVIVLSIPIEENSSKVVVWDPWFSPPYNPFIFANSRAKEIHLPNYPPTEQANTDFFGTADDASDPESGIYYRTSNYLSWGFNIAESTVYPIEKTQIIQAFNYFADWVTSEGNNYADWYQDKIGYRNENHIYQEP